MFVTLEIEEPKTPATEKMVAEYIEQQLGTPNGDRYMLDGRPTWWQNGLHVKSVCVDHLRVRRFDGRVESTLGAKKEKRS